MKKIYFPGTLIALLVSSFLQAKTPLLNEKVAIDFSKSENLFKHKNIAQKIKNIAVSYAKEGTAYKKPLSYHSINYVMNPVLDSKKYAYYFRFNLKASDGEILNCEGLANKELEKPMIGCYQALK